MFYIKIKRIIDVFLSFILLIGLSPVLLLLGIAVKLDSIGPVLFKQKRIGKDKTYFNILKYRTMRTDTPKNVPTHLLKNPKQYITKVGKFLRNTSLDELPQLWNIFVGDMSFIGPRPALWNQYDLIEQRDKYGANNILPGLSGWAQVNGRDELPINIKAKLDGEYKRKIGFLMDIKCVYKSVVKVFKKDGIVEGYTNTLDKENLDVYKNNIQSSESIE